MIYSSQDFGQALCDHLGLVSKKVERDMKMHVAANDVFSVTLTIALTPEDLAGIAAHMSKNSKGKDKKA
jgi:hypothetical protein